jgi:peptide chain release factor 3
VGALQLDVLAERAKQEYRVDIAYEDLPFEQARWLRAPDAKAMAAFTEHQQSAIVLDRNDLPVFLAKNAWELEYKAEKNPEIEFLKTREI